MKLSVSMSAEDVELLDEFVSNQGYPSRSAVVQRALNLLRAEGLGATYADAWAEWSTSPEAKDWDKALGDGLSS